jgi:hypothetical protein
MYTGTACLPILYIRNVIPDGMGNTPLGHLALSGWGKAFKIGHLADASTLGAPYSSARGRGQIRSPLVSSHPAYLLAALSTSFLCSAALRSASLKRCARFPVMRPCLPPVGCAQRFG